MANFNKTKATGTSLFTIAALLIFEQQKTADVNNTKRGVICVLSD